MGYTAKFTRGARTLTIDDDTYRLGPDFAPPPIRAEHNVGTGTSQNRTGGGERVGSRYLDRQWAFTVQVRASSEQAVVQAVRQLVGILEDDSEEQLYFHYKGNTLPEPSWGQFGALKKYPVLYAVCAARPGEYFAGDVRASQVNVLVTLTVAPFVEGKRVRAARAKGGVIIDYYQGQPRGLRLTDTTSNIFLNPVFGHQSYFTSWQVSNADHYKNTNPEYIYGGNETNVRIVGNGTAAAILQQLAITTAGTQLFAAVIKLEDSGTPSGFSLDYNGTTVAASTYDLKNGFYCIAAAKPGTLSSGAVGLQTTTTTPFYVSQMIFRTSGYGTQPAFLPVFSGDTLGGSWPGTIHNSAATITNGYLYALSDDIGIGRQGALHFVWSTGYGVDGTADQCLFVAESRATSHYFSAVYQQTTGSLIFKRHEIVSGGVTAATASCNVGTGIGSIIHSAFIWTPGQLNIYNSGTLAGSVVDASSTGAAAGSILYIGSRVGTSELYSGMLLGMTGYQTALSSAQVGSIYSEASAITSSGRGVGVPPLFWTKDVDSVLDDALDSSKNNYGIMALVPGDFDAKTELAVAQSSQVADHISINASPYYANPSYFYNDLSGGAMGSASGGSVQTFTDLGTTVTLVGSCNVTNPTIIRDYILGRDWYAITHMAGTAAGTVSGYVKVNIGGQSYTGATTTMVHGTTWTIRRANPCNVPRMDYLYDNTFGATYSADLLFYASRTDATANYLVDFVNFVPAPLTYVQGGASDVALILREGEALTGTAAYSAMRYADTFEGRRGLDVKPNQYNNIVLHMGIPGSAYDIARTGTLDFYVTPRWGLL